MWRSTPATTTRSARGSSATAWTRLRTPCPRSTCASCSSAIPTACASRSTCCRADQLEQPLALGLDLGRGVDPLDLQLAAGADPPAAAVEAVDEQRADPPLARRRLARPAGSDDARAAVVRQRDVVVLGQEARRRRG